MRVDNVTIERDGSQWVALVRVQGVLYVASYVANRLSVRLGPYKHNPRRPRWAEKSVMEWAKKQVAALPPEWMELHRRMYSE